MMKCSRQHVYAVIVTLCTASLLISGAAVTSSRDQPRQAFFQYVHPIAAAADTLLIAGLLIWLLREGGREWLPRTGWSILTIVIIDAGLGALLQHRSSVVVAGTLHAFFGALLFAAVAAIALLTSPSWQRDPELVRDYGWPSLRFLSGAAAFLVAMQIGFGAGIRHSAVGVMPHLLGALVVALFIVIVGAFVTNQFPKHASLRPMAIIFMVVTGIQAFLGMTAFLMRMMGTTGSIAFLVISVAHVATGSLVFAVSVMLAIEVRRCVLPRAQQAQ
jgi:heme A synthase